MFLVLDLEIRVISYFEFWFLNWDKSDGIRFELKNEKKNILFVIFLDYVYCIINLSLIENCMVLVNIFYLFF